MDGAVPTGAEKTAVLNEWRLWYGAVLSGSGVATPLDFALMDACPNSFQNGDVVDHPPRGLLDFCRLDVAPKMGNPYITIDVAETDDDLGEDEERPRWIIIEVGNGASSGPAPYQDMQKHWEDMWNMYGVSA